MRKLAVRMPGLPLRAPAWRGEAMWSGDCASSPLSSAAGFRPADMMTAGSWAGPPPWSTDSHH